MISWAGPTQCCRYRSEQLTDGVNVCATGHIHHLRRLVRKQGRGQRFNPTYEGGTKTLPRSDECTRRFPPVPGRARFFTTSYTNLLRAFLTSSLANVIFLFCQSRFLWRQRGENKQSLEFHRSSWWRINLLGKIFGALEEPTLRI